MKRIYHPWHKWECFQNGFYETASPVDHPLEEYAEFLRDIPRFERAMSRVVTEWPYSCEHFLSNPSMNRIAWLGQAAMCIDSRVPSTFRSGFKLLSDSEQDTANQAAQIVLDRWQHEKN